MRKAEFVMTSNLKCLQATVATQNVTDNATTIHQAYTIHVATELAQPPHCAHSGHCVHSKQQAVICHSPFYLFFVQTLHSERLPPCEPPPAEPPPLEPPPPSSIIERSFQANFLTAIDPYTPIPTLAPTKNRNNLLPFTMFSQLKYPDFITAYRIPGCG